jgi:membrane protease YdiL (CAAX protease family)
VPYALVVRSRDLVHLGWLLLYAALPVAIAWMLWQARQADRGSRGTWRDYCVLAVLGLAVDLRWFERAWPAHLAVFNKMLLLDAGTYGFLMIRQLDGVGFNLLIRKQDVTTGFREFASYTPIALVLGLSLRFLHVHAVIPHVSTVLFAYAFTFLFIAVPEELFFRGWMQNLLERRVGRGPALLLTSLIFGLSHFNKRTLHFNWQYVLLAALAGVFYGRAWRADRQVGASAITHACVDTVWSQWLR